MNMNYYESLYYVGEVLAGKKNQNSWRKIRNLSSSAKPLYKNIISHYIYAASCYNSKNIESVEESTFTFISKDMGTLKLKLQNNIVIFIVDTELNPDPQVYHDDLGGISYILIPHSFIIDRNNDKMRLRIIVKILNGLTSNSNSTGYFNEFNVAFSYYTAIKVLDIFGEDRVKEILSDYLITEITKNEILNMIIYNINDISINNFDF